MILNDVKGANCHPFCESRETHVCDVNAKRSERMRGLEIANKYQVGAPCGIFGPRQSKNELTIVQPSL